MWFLAKQFQLQQLFTGIFVSLMRIVLTVVHPVPYSVRLQLCVFVLQAGQRDCSQVWRSTDQNQRLPDCRCWCTDTSHSLTVFHAACLHSSGVFANWTNMLVGDSFVDLLSIVVMVSRHKCKSQVYEHSAWTQADCGVEDLFLYSLNWWYGNVTLETKMFGVSECSRGCSPTIQRCAVRLIGVYKLLLNGCLSLWQTCPGCTLHLLPLQDNEVSNGWMNGSALANWIFFPLMCHCRQLQ